MAATTPASEGLPPVDLVVMLGGMRGGAREALLRRALEAAALDTVDAALDSGRFDRAFLLTDAPLDLDPPAGCAVEIDGEVDGELDRTARDASSVRDAFSFGRALADTVARHRIEAVLYAGAGSAPLLDGDGLVGFAAAFAGATEAGRCVTNNRFSTDLFALTPASLLARLDPSPAADNVVSRRLRDEHGVEVIETPRVLETQFNLDSPVDLLALGLSGRARPRLAALLAESEVAMCLGEGGAVERARRAARMFTDRTAEVLVAGRVPSTAWRNLEHEAASRERVQSEARGKQAGAGPH
ncbi:MAG: hypothetical protein WD734_02090, partial [Dehalococcoidia bacterium]